MTRSSAIAGLAAGLLLAGGPARGGLATDPPPVQGSETVVTVTNDVTDAPLSRADLVARYRPGSEVSHDDTVGVTDAGGRIVWVPSDAGIVTLTATPPGDDPAPISRNLSVRYRGVPLPGLLILLAAGVILFGGVIRGFRSLSGPRPPRPPDT